MLEISATCLETMQAPFRERWIAWCSHFLQSRPEIAAMNPRPETLKFATCAYDWAAASGLTASESMARLAYLSILTTPSGADPANPAERLGLPATDQALVDLESAVIAALGES